MNTLLDVITLSEPIIKCGCNPVAETNCCDVHIVSAICATVIIVALIAKCTILIWKHLEIKAKEKECEGKRIHDKEDRIKKQEADLLEKLIPFLEKQCTFLVDKDGKRIDANMNRMEKDENATKEYIDLLKALLGIAKPKPQNNEY